MVTEKEKDAKPGQAIYTRPFLTLYDQYVSANHLDIGVGTGYFLDHCRFPAANPRLALMDFP